MSAPRCVAPLLAGAAGAAVYTAVDVVVPLALARRSTRHGWRDGRPGAANLLGALPLAAGAVVIVRAATDHGRSLAQADWRVVRVDPNHLLTPEYLVVDGMYRWSRNPLYVGDVLMWAGWAALLGSTRVAGGLGVLGAVLGVGVRFEERGLARRFGEAWHEYAAATPRFVGRRRQRSQSSP